MFKVKSEVTFRSCRMLALLILSIFLLASSYSSSWARKSVLSDAPDSSQMMNWSVMAQGKEPALSCNYCISPTDKSFTHEGGDSSIAVTAPPTCSWVATTSDSFITLISGTSGTGNGTLNFSVAPHSGSTRRVGTIAIAGRNFTVFQGVQFNDVAANHPFYTEIGKLSGRAITLGCGGGNYCPEQGVSREQMAAFLIRALGEPNPPLPASQRFADVPPSNFFYNFIDRLAVLGITLGCGTNAQGQPLYCPQQIVTREQMAAFLIRALGEPNPPLPASQRFADVPPSNFFYNFIDRLAVLQITLGCSQNPPLYCPADLVTRGQMAAFLIRAFDRPMNRPPSVNAGADQTITLPSAAMLSGTGIDDGLPACGLTFLWSQISGPSMVNFSDPVSQSTSASFSVPGTYVLRLMNSDSQLSSTDEMTIIVNPVNSANQPPSVNASADQTITLPAIATLNGTVTDDGVPTGNTLTASWIKVSGPGTVIFGSASAAVSTAMFSDAGSYVLRLTGNDSELTSSDEVLITVNPDPTPPPPDPGTVAPPVNPGVATTLGAATEFLYTGANPIQTGVAPGTINPVRAAVLRGRVKNNGSAPLSRVKISILNHPEFGQTFSRADGMFDIAVNGDDLLTVQYEKPGFIPVQRQERVTWQEYCVLKDVVMMGYDERVTHIDLSASVPFQVVQGSTSSDSDGTRRAALLFPQGTTATMVLANGTTEPLVNLHIRATEYTVGANGPEAMPGNLPPTSAYTYAVEYSVDEAVAAGARSVLFSQPVISYLENFLNFPVGGIVPVGGYDRQQVGWMPSANGRVIRVLSIAAGAAELDTDGDGAVDNGVSLGVTLAERQRLTELYSAGQSLWRVPINHFSPWDCNWPYGPPEDATPPPSSATPPSLPDDPCEQEGSIIECQNQTLGERIAITGTPFSLNYRSDRVVGRRTPYMLDIRLSAATVPASLRRIELEVSVAGRSFIQSFAPAPNQYTTFTWDGQDAYGRTLQGAQAVIVHVGFVYGANYLTPLGFISFGDFGNSAVTINPAREEITISQLTVTRIGPWDARAQGLGGWTLSVHHAYDPLAQRLYLGDGSRRTASELPRVITSVAGGGTTNCNTTDPCGDGGPATSATINPEGICVDGQGNLFIADTFRSKIRKVTLDGIITTVAGTGALGSSGDGGPATQALLITPRGVAVDAQGNLFITDSSAHRIRKVDTAGIISTVAGTGVQGSSGDGGPATQAQLNRPQAIAVAPDGTFFIAEGQRIRRVSPSGMITSVADPNNVIQSPNALALDAEGNLFIGVGRVLRLSPDGRITTVAGGGGSGLDGIPATDASVQALGLCVDRQGNLYIADNTTASRRVRVVNRQGIITTVAGGGAHLVANTRDGLPATSASLEPVAVAVDERGNLLVTDRPNGLPGVTNRVRRVGSILPPFSGPITIASEDGSQLFNFDSAGRHLSTINALTAATLYSFAYDSAARLVSVTDGDGNVTTIERNTSGQPTGILAPFGQRTTVTLNANGYLESLANPAGETTQCGYTNDGLLTSFTDPRGNVSTMSYDSLGRLMRDEAPSTSGSFWNLTRTETANSFTVSLTSALNRTTSYQVERLATGEERRVNTFPDGLQNRETIGTNGSRTGTFPDGSVTTLTPGPDPRWSMQSPLDVSESIRTPRGLIYTSTQSRAVTLSNPNDPLSLVTQTDTDSINGRIYTSLYTAASRTSTSSTPVGRQMTTTIDMQGRITRRQFANLNPASFTYDASGRLFSSTFGSAPQARSFGFGYNSDGYLSGITDPLNRVQSFLYDLAGQVTQQTLPGNRQISYSYDANNNLTSITPPGRPAHTFAYMPLNLLASYTPPDVGAGTTQTLYAYNSDRQLTRITRPDSLILDFAYDGAGRLSTLTIPGAQYLYTYNATTGNLESIIPPGSNLSYSFDGSLLTGTTWAGTISGSVSRTYDNNFRITSQSINGSNAINFQYDNDSRLTNAGSLTLTRNVQNGLVTGTTLSNVTDTWGYNDFAEPMNYSAAFSGTGIYSAQYNTRDNLGRITQKTETIGGVTDTYNYTYDLMTGWLTGVQKNSVTIATYTYDSNGNRLSYTGAGSPATGTYDNQDRLMQYGGTTYSYTPNGELLSKTSGGQNTAYQYDVLGNLKAVTLPDNTQIEYLVDGQNRRVGKRVNGTLVQGFLYQNQLNPIAELDGSNNVVSRFVYGSRFNVPDYLIRGGVTYRILSDHLGSVRLVVNVVTGAIAQRLDYDEFGVVLADSNPGFQPFGFAGGIYDTHTKLVRFGARDYEAEVGRWTAKDPIGFAGGEMNLFSYAANNPLNFIDPTGQQVPATTSTSSATTPFLNPDPLFPQPRPPHPLLPPELPEIPPPPGGTICIVEKACKDNPILCGLIQGAAKSIFDGAIGKEPNKNDILPSRCRQPGPPDPACGAQ